MTMQASENGTQKHKAFYKTAALPPIDVFESADEILIVADVPGATAENLSVEVHADVLKFESTPAYEAEQGRALFAEFAPRRHARTLQIPKGIDADGITVETKNGVVTIHMPKRPQAKPRQIKVKSG
jgi:HSP20 family molecular chaperone IbpA